MINFAGLPTMTYDCVPLGNSGDLVTQELAPTIPPSGSVTPGIKTTLVPKSQHFPTWQLPEMRTPGESVEKSPTVES